MTKKYLPDFFIIYIAAKKQARSVFIHVPRLNSYYIKLFCYISHAEAESSHLVFAHANNFYNITNIKNIFYFVDSLFRNLRNVNHSFFSRSEFNKCSKLLDACYFTFKNLACFLICYDNVDHLCSFFHLLFICSTD